MAVKAVAAVAAVAGLRPHVSVACSVCGCNGCNSVSDVGVGDVGADAGDGVGLVMSVKDCGIGLVVPAVTGVTAVSVSVVSVKDLAWDWWYV